MSNVPKNKRNQSSFETDHQLDKFRDTVTALMFNDFGYSEKKYRKYIEYYRRTHEKSTENIDELVEQHEIKCKALHEWFIEEERKTVSDLMRDISREFTVANSIFPSKTPAKEDEFRERRIHMDLAIAHCYALKREMQYIWRTIPVDKNKYCSFDDEIEKLIHLFKGVKKSDNRFIKNNNKNNKKKNNEKKKSMAKHLKVKTGQVKVTKYSVCLDEDSVKEIK